MPNKNFLPLKLIITRVGIEERKVWKRITPLAQGEDRSQIRRMNAKKLACKQAPGWV